MTDRRESKHPQGSEAEASGAFAAIPEDLEPIVPVLKKVTQHMKGGNAHLERVNKLVHDQNSFLRAVILLLAVGCICGMWLGLRLEMLLGDIHTASSRVSAVSDRLVAFEQRVHDRMANKADVAEAVKEAAEDAKSEPKPELVTDAKDPTKVKVRIPVKPSMPTPQKSAAVVEIPVQVPPEVDLKQPEEKK